MAWCTTVPSSAGIPAIPLECYTDEDLKREAARPKACAPFCTISCVHQVAMLDDFRTRPREILQGILDRSRAIDPEFETPALVKVLDWAFLSGPHRRVFARIAASFLRVR